MIAGILSSRCGNALAKNALGVDSNGNLALFASGVPGPDNVTWWLGQGIGSNGAPLGAFLMNKQSGGYLYTYWKPGYLAPFLGIGPVSVLDGWSTWGFGGPTNSGYVAVRPFANDDWNLNIIGGCDGTSVGLWGWGGGGANEIWRFSPDPVSVRRPVNYSVIARCGGYLGANPTTNQVYYDGTFKRPAGAAPIPYENYHWQAEVAIGKTPVEKVAYPMSGLALVTKVKGKAIKANGSGNAVSLVDLGQIDGNSAWNTGDAGGGNVALRPLSDDDQNLNISGGCGGTQVITYGWGGGQSNELWKFIPPV